MAPKKNGFFFLMLEIQRTQEEKGIRCTRAAAQKLADPVWRNLSDQEKERYYDMARKANKAVKNDLTQKFSTLGISLATIEKEQREKTENLNLMSSNIKETIETLHKKNKLQDHPFFVCHVNYYYKTEDNYYAPAEFALSVFSFKLGRIDSLHFFIDVGKIPLGFQFTVKDLSQRFHQIPVNDPSWKEPLKDYYDMYSRVVSFIQNYSPDEIPPLFTMCDSLNNNFSHSAVQCAFENMCNAAKMDSSIFRIYYLDKLFFEVIRVCRASDILSSALMRAEIEKDAFSYAGNLGCDHHENIDASLNCSLSMVTRWIYTMCDHCCKDMKIDLILGHHVPFEVDVNWKKTNHRFVDGHSIHTSTSNLSFISQDEIKKETRREDLHHDQRGSMRAPKSLYTSKIGARFETVDSSSSNPDPSSRQGSSSDEPYDSEWTVVSKHGMGRGKTIPNEVKKSTQTLPISGRGRLASMKR